MVQTSASSQWTLSLCLLGQGRQAQSATIPASYYVQEFGGSAGKPLNAPNNVVNGNQHGHDLGPFSSKLEWDIARWAKLDGPTETSLSKLLAMPGVRPLCYPVFHFHLP